MKQKILFFSILFLLFPIITQAVITGKIYEAIEDGNGGFVNRDFGDLQLKFKLSSGENFIVDTDREGNYQFDQDNAYCWKNCNILPPIHIFETELTQDGVVVANLGYSLSNFCPIDEQSFYQISNVYTDTKTNVLDSPAIPENIMNEKAPVLPVNEENVNIISVLWNGSILVSSTDTYTLFLNISGGVVLIVDDKLLIDDWRDSLNTERNAVVELEQGVHNLTLLYYTSKDYGLPNLFWSSESFEKTILPKNNLLFKTGGSKIYDLPLVRGVLSKMGTLSLPNPSYYPTGTYWNYDIVEPWKRPLILIHGLHGSPTNSGYGYWYNIDSDFLSNGEDVWKFKYYPAHYSNYFNGAILKNAIGSILSNYNQLSDKRVDIVAHSMGGIVARVYTSNIALDSSLSIVPYNNDVRKIVTIGSPHFGSYQANRVLQGESAPSICEWFFQPNPNEPAYKDLAVGSELTWELAEYGLNPNIDYLSIAGMDDDLYDVLDLIDCFPYESSDSDSIVSATSASLLPYDIPLILMNANHDNLRGDCHWHRHAGGHPKCGGSWFDPVWDSYYQSDLISDFLDGKSTTILKSHLNNEVEKIEYYVDSTDPYADTNYPYSEGTVLVKFSDGSNPSSVWLLPGHY